MIENDQKKKILSVFALVFGQKMVTDTDIYFLRKIKNMIYNLTRLFQ